MCLKRISKTKWLMWLGKVEGTSSENECGVVLERNKGVQSVSLLNLISSPAFTFPECYPRKTLNRGFAALA